MFQPGSAGVNHFRELCIELDVSVGDEDVVEETQGPRPRNLHMGGTPINMTIKMVSALIEHDSVIWKIASRSPNSMEYEVAGTMLWLTSLGDELLKTIDENRWLEVPLDLWYKKLKPMLDMVRRSGMLGKLKSDDVYKLRKLASISIRRSGQADWIKERNKRSGSVYLKTLMTKTKTIDELQWKHALKSAEKTIRRISERTDCGDISDWWSRRHHHIPGGSTSCGSWARRLFDADKRFTKNDRPGKKSVVEALPDDIFDLLFAVEPHYIARASTKMELGLKLRALYAANEICYLISAFASVHAEKEMKSVGCCARQTPEDFLKWASLDASSDEGYWNSADFSDYNGEHTFKELALMDLARASAWLKVGGKVGREKAAASLWTAMGYNDAWVTFPDTKMMTRIFHGMFSGSRDTQRNNTDQHEIDLEVAHEDATDLGYTIHYADNEGSAYYSGDDEDTKFEDELSACILIKTYSIQGHDLNPVKQLAGIRHHEFLQVMAHPDSTLQRPLAAILGTLASGNWYVPSATWFASLINGVSDNWWESAVRGLPLMSARHMACAYLDTIMRVYDKEKEKWIELEWWDFRSPGRVHPLWQLETAAPPVVREKPTPLDSWPSNATEAWLNCHKKILAELTQEKVDLYRLALLEESHGSAFLDYRQTVLKKKVCEIWPARIKRRYLHHAFGLAPAMTAKEMAVWYMKIGTSTRPQNDGELASRLGVDPQIVSLVGGWSQLSTRVSGERWASYEPVLPTRVLSPRAAASSWAFRSWAAKTAAPIKELHTVMGEIDKDVLIYIYAGNGAGKSWLLAQFSSWADMDVLSAPISKDKPAAGFGKKLGVKRHQFLVDVLTRCKRERKVVLLGQWDPEEIRVAAKAIDILMVNIPFEPGVELRKDRLRARGWTEEKIQRRAERWFTFADSCETWEELVLRVAETNKTAIPSSFIKKAKTNIKLKLKNESFDRNRDEGKSKEFDRAKRRNEKKMRKKKR